MESKTFSLEELYLAELVSDMERLGARVYSEIGVPMFLVAEDLTAEPTTRPTAQPAHTSALLASAFSQAAEALRKRKPELDAGDVARLVEVLADRYFFGFATPAFSLQADLHETEAK